MALYGETTHSVIRSTLNNFNAFKMHVLNSVQNSVIMYGSADSIPFSKAAGVAGIPGHIQVGCPYFCVHVTILFRYQRTRLSVLVPRKKVGVLRLHVNQ